MGIKDLWTILTPFCERKPLYELQGKTVAIDLSGWICEAQNIADYSVQPRMYLRNLYFRTCYLLLMDVRPIFVLEGKAPELKYQTMAARNAIQFKGAKPRDHDAAKPTGKKDRTRFNHTLRQCEEMLRLMGVVCVRGRGEAEALCAHLNADGLVDAIISQDSDCFAYGACVVYRNFSISQQGAHASSGGSVDVYDFNKARQMLNDFGRNKIVALALLCGSDYSDGVHGIGKDSAMKLFDKYADSEILERLHAWTLHPHIFHDLEATLNDRTICTSCGHAGKVQSHTRNGCPDCRTTKSCDSTRYKATRLDIKNELNMRARALAQDGNFPNTELIDEFLTRKDDSCVVGAQLRTTSKWNRPDLRHFVEFTVKYLMWLEIYAVEKFLPILTRWHLLNTDSSVGGVLHAERINKVRNPKGVPSYEIVWTDRNNSFIDLIPSSQIDESTLYAGDNIERLWTTIEPQNLVSAAYPALVETYEESIRMKKKKGNRKRATTKKTVGITDEVMISDLLLNTSITTSNSPVTKRYRDDNYRLKNKTKKQTVMKTVTTGDSGKRKVTTNMTTSTNTSTPMKFLLDQSNFGDENDLNLSDIVDEIVSKKMPVHHFGDKLDRLGLKAAKEEANNDRNSSFFGVTEAQDLFEASFNNRPAILLSSSSSDDLEQTVEYAYRSDSPLDGAILKDDSFGIADDYVPLAERLGANRTNLLMK